MRSVEERYFHSVCFYLYLTKIMKGGREKEKSTGRVISQPNLSFKLTFTYGVSIVKLLPGLRSFQEDLTLYFHISTRHFFLSVSLNLFFLCSKRFGGECVKKIFFVSQTGSKKDLESYTVWSQLTFFFER